MLFIWRGHIVGTQFCLLQEVMGQCEWFWTGWARKGIPAFSSSSSGVLNSSRFVLHGTVSHHCIEASKGDDYRNSVKACSFSVYMGFTPMHSSTVEEYWVRDAGLISFIQVFEHAHFYIRQRCPMYRLRFSRFEYSYYHLWSGCVLNKLYNLLSLKFFSHVKQVCCED